MLTPVPPNPTIVTANSTQQLLDLWLHGKSVHSQRAYRRDVNNFLTFTGKPLEQITLNDLQSYHNHLINAHLADATVKRQMAGVKSLLSFAHTTGLLGVNVGRALRLQKIKDTRGERILSESQVLSAIALEPNQRNRIILRFLYASGCRVSELCALKWRDFRDGGNAGIVTIYGKGRKTRTVRFSAETWDQVQQLRGDRLLDDFVFWSRKQEGLKPNQVREIVAKAGERIGVDGVSPHWLRHSHASHNVNRGTPLPLVQATLGHESLETTGQYLHLNPQDSSAMHLPV